MDGFGVGVVSGRAVLPGQRIVRVPFSLCITPESVEADNRFSARLERCMLTIAAQQSSDCTLMDCVGALCLPMRVRIWLYMIYGRWDSAAPHHHYLRLCPESFEDPLWWSEAELAELKGTNLFAAVNQEQRLVAHLYAAHVRPLTQFCPDEFPPAVFSHQAMLWASSAWKSRAFPRYLAGHRALPESAHSSGQVTGALLPIIDSFNHQTGTMIEYRVGPPGTGVELWTPADMPAELFVGQQLWINYGVKPDEEWVFNHGFCPVGNARHNTVELALACIGPLSLMRQGAKAIRETGTDVALRRSGNGQNSVASLRAGPFTLRWRSPPRVEDDAKASSDKGGLSPTCVDFPSGLLRAAMVILSKCQLAANRVHPEGGKHGMALTAIDRLLKLLEERIRGLRHHLPDRSEAPREGHHSPALPHARASSRGTLAQRYIAGQRRMLQGATSYLQGLKETELQKHSAEAAGAGGAANGLCSAGPVQMRLLFEEEDEQEQCNWIEGGVEHGQRSDAALSEGVLQRVDDCSTGESVATSGDESSNGQDASEEEEGEDEDADEEKTDETEGLSTTEMEDFVLFGDGATIRVTMPKFLARVNDL